MSSQEDEVFVGSGNVYADLGFEDPVLEATKAGLARQIIALVNARELSQRKAAEELDLNPSDVSRLMRGQLGRFSTDRLMKLLNRLDVDVDITVGPKEPNRPKARIAVFDNFSGYGSVSYAMSDDQTKTKKGGVQFS